MLDRDIVTALVRVVELKDHSTARHTWRVALYTQALAEAAGVPDDEIPRLMNAAVLHDIGKIDIPEAILAKPGRLTDDEFAIMKTHTVLGYDRLVRMGETDPLILSLVRSHHERLDGSGYPDGLRGEEISRAARYFAVIDSFEFAGHLDKRSGRNELFQSQFRGQGTARSTGAVGNRLEVCGQHSG